VRCADLRGTRRFPHQLRPRQRGWNRAGHRQLAPS
jgi:hypothetical protein